MRTRPLVQRAVPVTRLGAEHDRRLELTQHVVADPQPIERAVAEPLDDDVGRLGELEEELLPRRVTQVQADALLAAVQVEVEVADALAANGELTLVAQRRAVRRWLDLDDLGAHVREVDRRRLTGRGRRPPALARLPTGCSPSTLSNTVGCRGQDPRSLVDSQHVSRLSREADGAARLQRSFHRAVGWVTRCPRSHRGWRRRAAREDLGEVTLA